MNITIFPSIISGILKVPASKSQFIRTVAAAMIAGGTSRITNPSTCDDAMAILRIAEQFGAKISSNGNMLEIEGTGDFPGGQIFLCNESGLVARIMLSLASLSGGMNILKGSGTLLNRDLGDFEGILGKLGVKCESDSGRLPVMVKGPLTGGKVEVDGSKSSQFISGLLMALPMAQSDSVLMVHDLKSRPYLDMTLETLNTFGVRVLNVKHRRFIIRSGQKYNPADVEIEGDWSGAAFLFVAGAISGNVRIVGLNPLSLQADRAIIQALEKAGAQVVQKGAGYAISQSELKSFKFDATDRPDLFPPLVVLAAYSKGTSVIKGATRLFNKESNRANALLEEFGKLGVEIQIQDDEMRISGGTVQGGTISSRDDHRIAMAAAVAGIRAKNPVTIEQAGCVAKSWPGFFDGLKRLGVKVDLINK